MNEPDVAQIRANLELVRQMVDQLRRVRARSGHIYVAIGMLFVAAGPIDVWWTAPNSWMLWPAAGVLSFLYSLVAGRRLAKTEGRVGYAGPIEGVAWLVSTLVIGAYTVVHLAHSGAPPTLLFPLICLTISIPLAVSASLYRAAPLALGSLAFFAGGILSGFLGDAGQRLTMSAAMAVGYVAPGLWMMIQARNA